MNLELKIWRNYDQSKLGKRGRIFQTSQKWRGNAVRLVFHKWIEKRNNPSNPSVYVDLKPQVSVSRYRAEEEKSKIAALARTKNACVAYKRPLTQSSAIATSMHMYMHTYIYKRSFWNSTRRPRQRPFTCHVDSRHVTLEPQDTNLTKVGQKSEYMGRRRTLNYLSSFGILTYWLFPRTCFIRARHRWIASNGISRSNASGI